MNPDTIELAVMIVNAAQDAMPGLVPDMRTDYAKVSWLGRVAMAAQAQMLAELVQVDSTAATGDWSTVKSVTNSKPWDDLEY